MWLVKYIDEICLISDSFTGNNVEAYQIALGVVIPVLIIIDIIIIGGVIVYVKKLRTKLLAQSTTGDVATPYYENQDSNRRTRPGENAQAKASESAYDEIDTTDIDMSSSVYDRVDTEQVEYETVQWAHG